MIKLTKILREIIDIYSPDELDSKGIKYNITRENEDNIKVQINYKDKYYLLKILPIYGKYSSLNFGSTDENYDNLNLHQLLNSPYSSRILATIFGLIRYWVDKYDVQGFEYGAEGQVRSKLYDYYLNKHFSDFQKLKSDEPEIEHPIIIWTKK